MPSKKTPTKHRRQAVSRKSARSQTAPSQASLGRQHIAFYPLLVLTLIVWFIYRRLFIFPVWFDETIGKAIFFGLPVWLYATTVNARSLIDTFASNKIKPGLLLGIAIGGIFGFSSALLAAFKGGGAVTAAQLFSTNAFWWEFFLSLMTGFWESLFFFSWIMTAVMEKHVKWPLMNQILLVASIFLVFHIPNTLLRFGAYESSVVLALLFFFAVGQGYVFSRWRNLYALAVTHAVWGMVLLVHF